MASALFPHRTSGYKPFLGWFCAFALLWTILLLKAGGFTTSIQAGMVFLDWPLSHGSVNPEGWLHDRDMLAEHSHRLLGTIVGLLVIGIFGWLLVREGRRWVRWLGLAALILVVVQGLAGGARVLFDQLNTQADSNLVAQTFRVIHACLAQVFFCVLATIAIALSRPWIERRAGLRAPVDRATRFLGIAACAGLFLQLLAGALVRHNYAALAIPTFPWSSSQSTLLPLAWSFPVTVHFIHRAGALVVTVALLAFAWKLWRSRATGFGQKVGAGAMVAALAFQIFLGALTVLTLKNEYVATLHMLVGAFMLAGTWVLTFSCHRLATAERFAGRPVAGTGPGLLEVAEPEGASDRPAQGVARA